MAASVREGCCCWPCWRSPLMLQLHVLVRLPVRPRPAARARPHVSAYVRSCTQSVASTSIVQLYISVHHCLRAVASSPRAGPPGK